MLATSASGKGISNPSLVARAMGRTGRSRWARAPAHLSRERNNAQFLPGSVLGAVGSLQPRGMTSDNSSSEKREQRWPQWVWNFPAPCVSSSGL